MRSEDSFTVEPPLRAARSGLKDVLGLNCEARPNLASVAVFRPEFSFIHFTNSADSYKGGGRRIFRRDALTR